MAGIDRPASPQSKELAMHIGDWYRSVERRDRSAFWASSLGWALDAFDFTILPLALSAIIATFGLSAARGGTIVTVTLVASSVGGVLAGLLADRIGRARTLMLTIATYSIFTALSGLAQNYEQLIMLKSMQGLGFGGEWAAGATLVAEIASPRYRGRVIGLVSSAWAFGWAAAVISYTVIFSVAGDQGWRYLFLIGIMPGLLVLYIRRKVRDPEVFVETRRSRVNAAGIGKAGVASNGVVQLFRKDLRRTTIFAVLVGVGAQGGYWAVFTWLPSYLYLNRHLAVVGTGVYLSVIIVGMFVGYVYSGYLHDRIGRRKTFALFACCGIILVAAYTRIPVGENWILIALGAPLGIAAAGTLSGTGTYFSELFPSRVRATGVGLANNFGRGIAAFFPALVGALSGRLGLATSISIGTAGYLLVIVAVRFLPETRGTEMHVLD
jgi:MFS family permease